jgi:alpha-beta hydrolase superfamily lysophospholipase
VEGVGAGLRFGRARLRNGPQLHYAQQGEADAEAILFLHGRPDSWFSFSRVLPLLPPRYHALAVSQRGFGDSERPDSGYAIDDLARDAADFLDAVAIGRATVECSQAPAGDVTMAMWTTRARALGPAALMSRAPTAMS